MPNQTAIYQYTWKHGWGLRSQDARLTSTEDQVKADLRQGMAKAAFQELAAKFAEIGKWLTVDSVVVDIIKLTRFVPASYEVFYDAEGTTQIIFRTNATPNEDFAPATGFMGWDDLLTVIVGTIITVILAHQTLFFILLIIIALTWFALSGGFKGVLFGQGGGSLADIGTIIAIAILGFGGLLVLSSVLGKEKSHRTRKG